MRFLLRCRTFAARRNGAAILFIEAPMLIGGPDNSVAALACSLAFLLLSFASLMAFEHSLQTREAVIVGQFLKELGR